MEIVPIGVLNRDGVTLTRGEALVLALNVALYGQVILCRALEAAAVDDLEKFTGVDETEAPEFTRRVKRPWSPKNAAPSNVNLRTCLNLSAVKAVTFFTSLPSSVTMGP